MFLDHTPQPSCLVRCRAAMYLLVGCILRHLITCRRAFSRLLDRLFEVKEDFSQLKADKRELLRATYAAVRGEKAPDAAAATIRAPDNAILGRDGPLRVCTSHEPSHSCQESAFMKDVLATQQQISLPHRTGSIGPLCTKSDTVAIVSCRAWCWQAWALRLRHSCRSSAGRMWRAATSCSKRCRGLLARYGTVP